MRLGAARFILAPCPFGRGGNGMAMSLPPPTWVQTPAPTSPPHRVWCRGVMGPKRHRGAGEGFGVPAVVPVWTMRLIAWRQGRARGEGSGAAIRAVCQPVRFPLVFLLGAEIRAGSPLPRHEVTPWGR